MDQLVPSGVASWVFALFFFGLGDTLTTVIGLTHPQIVETSPLVQRVFEGYGVSGLIGLKLFAFLIVFIGWKKTPEPYDTSIPALIAGIGLLLTVHNGTLLFFHY